MGGEVLVIMGRSDLIWLHQQLLKLAQIVCLVAATGQDDYCDWHHLNQV